MVKRTDFFCIGAQKAGTTTLHDIISGHGGVFLPQIKETKFFADDDIYRRGIDYYHDTFFAGRKDEELAGEVDPEYLYFPDVPGRIHAYAPGAKIIVMFRNPVDRAYSHYLMSVRRGFEKESFEDAIKLEEKRLKGPWIDRVRFSYIDRGFYSRQLERYLALFPRENFHFILLEDLKAGQWGNGLCEFLGIDPDGLNTDIAPSNQAARPKLMWLSRLMHGNGRLKAVAKKHLGSSSSVVNLARMLRDKNMTQAKFPPVNAGTRKALSGLYAEDIMALSKITGRDLSPWLR